MLFPKFLTVCSLSTFIFSLSRFYVYFIPIFWNCFCSYCFFFVYNCLFLIAAFLYVCLYLLYLLFTFWVFFLLYCLHLFSLFTSTFVYVFLKKCIHQFLYSIFLLLVFYMPTFTFSLSNTWCRLL